MTKSAMTKRIWLVYSMLAFAVIAFTAISGKAHAADAGAVTLTPTKGVSLDIGNKRGIYELVRSLAAGGVGILMISALSFMGIPDIHRMNAVKAILGFMINGITAVIFIIEGVVIWKYAIMMAITSTAGGYLGARLARRFKSEHVRTLVVTIGFAVAAYSFYKRFAT